MPSPIVLAFSGGLDTSFLVPWLREPRGADVVTVTVDTGALDQPRAPESHRKALFGYSGYVPANVNVGDRLNLLNLGERIGVPAHITQNALPPRRRRRRAGRAGGGARRTLIFTDFGIVTTTPESAPRA